MNNLVNTVFLESFSRFPLRRIGVFAMFLCMTFSNIDFLYCAENKKLSPQVEAKIKNSIAQTEAQAQKLKPNERKIESNLRQLIGRISNEKRSGVFSDKAISHKYSNSAAQVNDAMQVQVVVTLLNAYDVDTMSIRNQIDLFGGRVRLIVKPSPSMPVELYCWIPFDKIGILSENASIGNISLTSSPTKRIGAKYTLGDVQLNADKAREYFVGKDGTGIKVGVISTGVPNINSSIGSQDLPSMNNTTHILNAGNTGDNEGTAMLEIVHDLAPGADLYFAGVSPTDMPNDMAGRIIQLRDAGCKVIVDDLGWPYESPQYSFDYLSNTVADF